MFFDHDKELGAVLLADFKEKKITGVMYRYDDAKELHVLDVKGNWCPACNHENPYLRGLPLALRYEAWIMDRDKIAWMVVCDWYEETFSEWVHNIAEDMGRVRMAFGGTPFNPEKPEAQLQSFLDHLDTFDYVTE